MWQVHHPSFCLPRVPPVIVQFDDQTTTFHSLCTPQDQAPSLSHVRRTRPLAATEGAIPDCSGIVRSPPLYIGLHARIQGHLRRHVLQQIVVYRCPRHVPVAGDQPDGAGDVPVPRVGAKRRPRHSPRVRRNDPKRLRWLGSLPYVYPPLDKEVDAATHCKSFCGVVNGNFALTVLWTTVSISPKARYPRSPQPFGGLYDSPYDPRHSLTVLFPFDVTSVVSLSFHSFGDRRSYRQNRLCFVVPGSLKSRGYCYRSFKNKDVCLCLARSLVIVSYCSSYYSLRTIVLKTILIVYSPALLLFQVAHRIFKDLSIPCPLSSLAVGDMEYRWRRTLCFISHWAILLHTHVVSIAAYNFFFP